MKYKSILLLIIVLSILLSISSVSAIRVDNNISNITTFNDNNQIWTDNNIQSDSNLNTNLNSSSSIYVSLNGSDINGDGSLNNPYNSIYYAINKSTSGSTIYISNGEYSGVNNTCIYTDKTLILTAVDFNKPTIINSEGYDDSIFTVLDNGKLTFNGLTFVNGKSDQGGAIMANSGSIININNCTFINNKASRGGFMYNLGTLTLTNSYIINSTAEEIGGALKNWGKSSLINDTFIGNLAKNSGGAIYNFYFPLNIKNCTFIKNSAYYVGGTIHNVGTLNLFDSCILNSKSLKSDGGAICNDIYGDDIGSCTITNTNITHCSAVRNGGAIFNNEVQKLKLNNCSINYCSALNGGAIYNIADLILINNNMTNCVANIEGNTIYNLGNIGTSYLTFSTNSSKSNINKNLTLSVTVTDDNNNSISGENIVFLINNTEIGLANVTNGIGVLNYNFTNYGSYLVTGVYYGSNSSIFKSKNFNTLVNITNDTIMVTNLSASDLNIKYGIKSNYTVKLSSDNIYLSNQQIVLNLTRLSSGQSKIYNVVTDNYGLANLEIHLSIGNYNIMATYLGNEKYSKSNIITSLKVVKPNLSGTILTGENLTLINTIGGNYTVNLTDTNGKAISEREIALKLTRLSNGLHKVYYLTTNSKGIVKLPINLSLGNYIIEASFIGDSNFSSSQIKNSITIIKDSNKTFTKVSAFNFNQTFGAGVNFTGLLTDIYQYHIPNQQISVNLTRLSSGQSKIYWLTTSNNGKFQLPINLSKGNYRAICTYYGTNKYDASFDIAEITVR